MTKPISLTRCLEKITLAGIAGCLLRAVLYRVGFDEKNLLPRFHPLQLACLVLTCAVAMRLFLLLKQDRPIRPIRPTTSRRISCGLAAVLLALHGLTLLPDLSPMPVSLGSLPEVLPLVRLVFCAGGVLALGFIALHPTLRPGPGLALHALICLTFLLEMICRYRLWSGNPQLPDYCFQVLGCTCLVLTAYYRTAFFGGVNQPRRQGFFSLLGCYLCLVSLAGPEHWAYYLAGALWCGSGAMTLQNQEGQ